MSTEFRVIGKPQRRLDAFDRVTGRARYTSVFYLPGMLYLKALRSPHPHARIVNIDASKALALTGVKAVLTEKDVAAFPWHPAQPILTDVARFVGDEIAVVAAEDEATAIEALSLINVDYQVLPFVLDPEEALKPDAPKLNPQGNLYAGKPTLVSRGDVEKGFAEADLVYEGRYRTPFLQHATGESRVTVAQFDSGKLTIWESTQSPFEVQKAIARSLKIPISKVRVVCEAMGGGFGDKGGPGRQSILAAIVARKTGRPARMELDRDEHYLAATHRYPAICDLKYGVKKDGTLTAIQAKVTADGGAYCLAGNAAFGTMECMMSIYHCQNMRGEAYTVNTNNPPTGSMRCVGHPQGTFAQEVHMDAIAQKLGMDPVAFRLKNHARLEDGDQFKKVPFTSNGLAECIRHGAEAFQWNERWQKAGSGNGPVKRGLGMAIHGCKHGSMFPGTPLSGVVRVNVDGTVNVLTGATEIGGGQKTTMAMIAAEELGVLFEDVLVTAADTEVTTDTGGTSGSRQTITGGTGVKLAAADAKQQLLEIAAAELSADKKAITIRDSIVYVEGSKEAVPLEEIAAKAPGGVVIGRGVMQIPHDVFFHTFAAHFVEVEVDTRTGAVKVQKLIAAHDLGRVINLLGAENQIEGGAIQGTSFGLREQQLLDRGTGICVNPDHLNYKLPTIKDFPSIVPIMVESVDPLGPFGAKGLGEPPYTPPAPAIANAIYNAIGIRFSEIPITNRAILARLQAAKG
jgi:CO/xanthine dehydrogenase Mo-binding subunit